jgi:hypothetical protein
LDITKTKQKKQTQKITPVGGECGKNRTLLYCFGSTKCYGNFGKQYGCS